MMVADVIRNAESEYVIYFLLAAYVEAADFAGKLPGHLTNLPITGLRDVETRFQRLMREFDRPSEQHLHDKTRVVIKEALHIFDAALYRLKFLEREKEPLASNLSRDNAKNSPGRVHRGISRFDLQ